MNTSNSQKIKNLLWKFLVPIVVILTIIITGTFIAVYGMMKDFNIFWKFSNNISIEKTIHNVPIVERSVAIYANNRKIFFNVNDEDFLLGDEGLEMFIDKINERTGYGPEFFSLNQIILTNEPELIDNSAEGVYWPKYQIIVLNTYRWVEYFSFLWTARTQYLDTITEALYQTFYHEYGHHVFNSYLLNNGNSKYQTEDIFTESRKGQRMQEPWNKFFTKHFKTNLSYDIETKKLADKYVKDYRGKDFKLENKIKVKSIASFYNVKELFDKANGKLRPRYDRLKNPDLIYYTFSSLVSENIYWTISDFNQLQYYYSFQELLTRKYMQLTFINYETDWIKNGILTQIPFNYRRPLTYLADTKMYQYDFKSDHRFFEDAPFKDEDTANNLIDLFHNMVGQKQAIDLSFIWNASYKYDFETNEIVKKNHSQIKWGGFLDAQQAERYDLVGYWNDAGELVTLPIQKFPYTYNRLKKLGGKKRLSISNNGAKEFYVTNSWIDFNMIKNRKLYFFSKNDSKINAPLKSIKQPDLGLTSTQRFYGDFNDIKASINDQQVILS